MQALAFSGGKDSWACFYLLREQLDCAIYVDTGFAYPEIGTHVERIAQMLPLHIVTSDRQAQNQQEGIPSDVVPVEWTPLGQRMTHRKTVTIQPSLSCCYANLARPLLAKAHELGVTHLVYGQRADESHRGVARDGDMIEGITRLHPIEDWTQKRVLDYIATQMEVPAHFALTHSSLDCYDCTAYRQQSQDRLDWTKDRYPDFYEAYMIRQTALQTALQEALQ